MARGPLGQTARSAVIPAPSRGWNARDALEEMDQQFAVVLDNLISGPGGVAMRAGSVTYATGLGVQVNALLRYNPPGQSPRLFAGAGPNLYDVSLGGQVGPASLSAQIGDRWLGANFGTPGGNYLMIANGYDPPQKFDGVAWSPISLKAPAAATYTGQGGTTVNFAYPYVLVPSRLMAPVVFGQRVWFVERGSLRVWFLPINAIGSSVQIDPISPNTVPDLSPCAQALDFASQCQLGGSLVAMAVWSRQTVYGSSNFAVFITSAGEVLIYQGTDPTIFGSWSKVGLFRIAPPIGDRPVVQAGADVAILTETGLIPLSSILPLSQGQDEQVAITAAIRGAFQTQYQTNATTFGWAVFEYPMGSLLIVNVPQANGTFIQFVMNLITQAWCSFSGLQAVCWGLLGDRIMFGTPDGRVCQFDVGSSDQGHPIQFKCLPAFSAFRTDFRKRFTMARPLFASVLVYRPPIALRVDYDTNVDPLFQPPVPAGSTPWGSPWGSPWAPPIKPNAQWSGLRGEGLVGSIFVSGSSLNPFRLDHIDVRFEIAGTFP